MLGTIANHVAVPVLKQTFRRFPVAILCCVFFCALSLTQITAHNAWPDAEQIAAWSAFYICFWSIAATVLAESREWASSRQYGVMAAGAALFTGMAWAGVAGENLYILSGFALWAFLGMFIAPFLTSRTENADFWVFSHSLAEHIAYSFTVAFIFFLGLIAILGGFSFLFLSLDEDIFFRAWIVVATVFAPVFAMTGVPSGRTRASGAEDALFGARQKIIYVYVAIPLLLIYGVMLYAYTAKILLTWTLPKGGVVYMVSGFALAGAALYFAVYPLRQTQGLAGRFFRSFFLLTVLPLILMGVAITTRIAHYGITEDRYAVLAVLIWLAFATVVAFIKNWSRHSLKIMVGGLMLLLIATSLTASPVSTRSQIARLKDLFVRNNLLTDGRITPGPLQPPLTDSNEIANILRYLASKKQLDVVKPWLAGHDLADGEESLSPDKILNIANIKMTGQQYTANPKDFSYAANTPADAVAVKGYDYVTEVNLYQYAPNQKATANDARLEEKPLSILLENSQLTVSLGGRPAILDLTAVIPALDKPSSVPVGIAVNGSGDGFEARLVLHRLQGRYETDAPFVTQVNGYLLLRLKSTNPGNSSD